MNDDVLLPGHNIGLVEKQIITNFIMGNFLGNTPPTKKNVSWSVDHAVSIFPHQGGFVVKRFDNNDMIAVAVVNKTGMENFVPNYLLSYLAIDKLHLKPAMVKSVLDKVIELSEGSVFTLVNDELLQERYEEAGLHMVNKDLRP